MSSNEQEAFSRLLSLTPVPSLKWRFITINPNALAAFARNKLPNTYFGKLEKFEGVFNFKRLKIDSIETLNDPSKKEKVAFSNLIRSDGYAADVVLMKSNDIEDNESTNHYEQDVDLSILADVIPSNELSGASLCSVDLNREQLFVAAYGEGEHSH